MWTKSVQTGRDFVILRNFQFQTNIRKMHTFGEYLRGLREEKNLSLRELSSMLKIDSSLIAKVERNERKPSREFIKQTAQFFNLDEKELLNEYVSDYIAYKIIDEDLDIKVLEVAEEKVNYIKNKAN